MESRGVNVSKGALRRLFGFSVLSALALLAAVGSASGLGLQPGCGDTITLDTKLTRNLVDCPNNGLVIGADGITLDLNGHVIDGDAAEFADCPPDEACDTGVVDFDHAGVTIKGGTVREFTFGALVVGASHARVAGVVSRTTSSRASSSPSRRTASSTGSPPRRTV